MAPAHPYRGSETSAVSVTTTEVLIYKSPDLEEFENTSVHLREKNGTAVTLQLWSSPSGTGNPVDNPTEWAKIGATKTLDASKAAVLTDSGAHAWYAVTGVTAAGTASVTAQATARPRK